MNPWIHVVGWMLIHFVWQGGVLSVAAAGGLWVCRRRSANTRYAIACVVLAAMLVSPVLSAYGLLAHSMVLAPVVGMPHIISAPGIVPTAVRNWTANTAFSANGVWESVDALLPVVVFLWFAGVTVLMLRMAGGLWYVRRLQVKSLATNASHWQMASERIASRLGLRVPVHVVESARIDTPTAVGWLRPVILLPIAALANLTPSQVEGILAHELIHIRRHDYLVNLAQSVAETLLFFHPGVWWVSGQIRREREHCCDDVAAAVCGDPVDYAAALAELETWRSRATTLALAATSGSLSGRVRRLLKVEIGHETGSLSWVAALTLAFMVTLMMGGLYASSIVQSNGRQSLTTRYAQAAEPIASPATFDWQVHRTEHFDIYYYAALAPRLEQIAESAERAYKRVSSGLQYDLSFRVPLIVFKTLSDFEQQGIVPEVAPAIASGDVTSFTEPKRNRIVMLVEDAPDRLYIQITHELSHSFAFDIIPRSTSNISRVPSWIDEGFAEYMTGVWDPADLRQVRDLIVANGVPRMTALTGSIGGQFGAADVNLGHAVFEFVEAQYGKAGVWQFLLEVRRSVVDGAADVYQSAFNRTPEQFDSAFAEYLRKRFGL